MELRLLRCALAVAEHHNFVRAARAIHMSQPSLSRNIQEIERQVGTRLFERGTGDVVPTDAGNIFLKQARELVARSADLEREMNLLKGLEKGELSIGSGTYPSAMMVDRAIVRLIRAHPAVRLHIWNDNWANLLPPLRRRELDLAVVAPMGIEDGEELHVTKLNPHPGYFVVRRGHPLLSSKELLTLQKILQFPVVSTSRLSGPVLKQFAAGRRAESVEQSRSKSFPAIACESIAMMKTISAGTDAVGLLPLNTVIEEVRDGRLALLSFVAPWMTADWAIVRLSHRTLSPLGETFVRFLLEADAQLFEFEQKNAPEDGLLRGDALFQGQGSQRVSAKTATRTPDSTNRLKTKRSPLAPLTPAINS
ncbi:MAG: LysR family transcriptional regulator [Terriglobales bacterium]